ncbi:MAG: hypothetical protein ABR928_09475 [Terracidiphilus sp.]|jgi:hypothetical protein
MSNSAHDRIHRALHLASVYAAPCKSSVLAFLARILAQPSRNGVQIRRLTITKINHNSFYSKGFRVKLSLDYMYRVVPG